MSGITDFTTLSFDCYGTLIDWERGILNELRPWADSHGILATDDGLLEAFGEAESQAEREMPACVYPRILEEALRRLASRWSVAAKPGEARRFGASVGHWPAFADSPAALAYLKQHYRLVVISNVDHASFAKSRERLGVKFDRVITAEDVGSYKPDARTFRYALDDIRRTLSVAPHQVLHTAQSLFHDIVPAKALGLKTMWINRRKGAAGWGATPAPAALGDAARPDFEVASLAELVELHQAALTAKRR